MAIVSFYSNPILFSSFPHPHPYLAPPGGLVHGASQLLQQRDGKLHAKLILDISKYAFEFTSRSSSSSTAASNAATAGGGGGAAHRSADAASTSSSSSSAAAAAAAEMRKRKRKPDFLLVKIRVEGMAAEAEKTIKIALPSQGKTEAQSDR